MRSSHRSAGRDLLTLVTMGGNALLSHRSGVPSACGADKTRGVTPGWCFNDHPTPGRILTHDGEVDGHSAMLWLAPPVKTTLIVLVNMGGDTAKRLTQQISRVVIGSWP